MTLSELAQLSPVLFGDLSTACDVGTFSYNRKCWRRMNFPIIIFVPSDGSFAGFHSSMKGHLSLRDATNEMT